MQLLWVYQPQDDTLNSILDVPRVWHPPRPRHQRCEEHQSCRAGSVSLRRQCESHKLAGSNRLACEQLLVKQEFLEVTQESPGLSRGEKSKYMPHGGVVHQHLMPNTLYSAYSASLSARDCPRTCASSRSRSRREFVSYSKSARICS